MLGVILAVPLIVLVEWVFREPLPFWLWRAPWLTSRLFALADVVACGALLCLGLRMRSIVVVGLACGLGILVLATVLIDHFNWRRLERRLLASRCQLVQLSAVDRHRIRVWVAARQPNSPLIRLLDEIDGGVD